MNVTTQRYAAALNRVKTLVHLALCRLLILAATLWEAKQKRFFIHFMCQAFGFGLRYGVLLPALGFYFVISKVTFEIF